MNAATPSSSSPVTTSPAVTKAKNSWGQAALAATTTLSYSPNNFYVMATDAKGHGEKINGRIKPEVYAQIQVLVHSGEFPDYGQPMDFVRDAIVHHIERRRNQLGDPSLRESLEALVRRLHFREFCAQVEREVNEWSTMQEQLVGTLITLQEVGAWAHIWEYLQRCEDYADPIAEPYRSAVLDTVNEWREKVPPEHRTGK